MVAQAVSTVALLLLAAAGILKMADPDPTSGALAAARLPSGRPVARALGIVEVIAALAALVAAGWWLVPAFLLYLGFLGFTLVAVRRKLPIQSCGCFGREDTPPSRIHVAFNCLSAAALGYLLAVNQTPVPWQEAPTQVALFLGFGLIGTYLSFLLLSSLPRTLQMTRDL